MRFSSMVAAIGVAVSLAGCTGDSSPAPAPTPDAATATAQPTPVAEATASGTTNPTVLRTYAIPDRDELFIYTIGTGELREADRLYPRRDVVVQNLRTGEVLSRFEYSGSHSPAGKYPVGVQLAGRQLVIATESSVTRYELDGSQPVELYAGSPGVHAISDIDVSSDGLILAVASGCDLPTCRAGAAVTFIEVGTGSVINTVDYAALTGAGFKGYAWQLRWRADGAGVVVKGGTGSEAVGGLALARADGSFVVYPQAQGYGSVSPDGRAFFFNVDQLSCMRVGGHGVRAVDLDSGQVLATEGGSGGGYAAWEWSPDSTQVVYQFLPGDTTECAWAEAIPEHRIIDLQTGLQSNVPSLHDLQARWYGDRFVEVACSPKDAEANRPVFNRLGDEGPVCRTPGAGEAVGDVFIGGARIARWPESDMNGRSRGIEIVGFLETAP